MRQPRLLALDIIIIIIIIIIGACAPPANQLSIIIVDN